METLSSSPCSNERNAHKRPIPIITIDSDEDDNEEFSSSAVKRGKNEATTEGIEDEASSSAESHKEELHDLNATEVSNASNLTNDAEVQRLKDLIHDVLKEQSLADDKASVEHIDSQTVSVVGDNNNSIEIAEIKEENGEDDVPSIHQRPYKHVKFPPSQSKQHEIIYPQNYEIQLKQNDFRKLVLFVPTNPNLCYNYRNPSPNYFICCKCEKNNKKTISAKLLKDKDGKEYVKAKVPHLCKPVPYVANKWHSIKAQNLHFYRLNQRIVVFNLDLRNFCYHYDYYKGSNGYKCIACLDLHQKHVSSKVIKDENGDECLLANKNHLCDPYTYKISDSFDIVKPPNFSWVDKEGNGSAAMVRVYASNVRSTCYNFTQMGSSYACSGCLTKGREFIAKIIKDDFGKEVVLCCHIFISSPPPPVCKPVNYVPQSPNFRIQQKETIIAPNYEIQLKQDGTQNLVVFVPTNPNLCYYYRKVKNTFVCCKCINNYKKHISAKVLTDKESTQYVQANFPHLCEPVPYVASKWHAIKSPNFIVSQLNKMLVVFNYDHRNFCYHYDYSKWIDGYNCIACFNSHHKRISAKLIKEKNGDECLQAINHLCDPFTYTISDAFNILKSPNFKFVNEETNDSRASILVLYATIARSTGYNFTQMGSSYACSGCLTKGREFIAKIFKDENDEDVVLIWKDKQHICLPIIC